MKAFDFRNFGFRAYKVRSLRSRAWSSAQSLFLRPRLTDLSFSNLDLRLGMPFRKCMI